jgi:hypothetical protein
LISRKSAVVEFLSRRDQVEEDAGQFMRGGCDGLGRTEFGPHSPVEVTQSALAVVEGLSRHP